MKKTLALLLLSTTLAHANLIRLTGPVDLTQPFPQPLIDMFGAYGPHQQNIAGANIHDGQVDWSPFTIYGQDHFTLGLDGSVSWNLIGTGWRLWFVFIEWFDNGTPFGQLFGVRGRELFNGDGNVFVDGPHDEWSGTFVGRTGVPDTGSTLALLSTGILGLLVLAARQRLAERS